MPVLLVRAGRFVHGVLSAALGWFNHSVGSQEHPGRTGRPCFGSAVLHLLCSPQLCLYLSPCRPHAFCPHSPTSVAFSLLCTTSPLTLPQHPQQLIGSCDGAIFPHPGTKSHALPCQHLITPHPAQRTLQTLYKPRKTHKSCPCMWEVEAQGVWDQPVGTSWCPSLLQLPCQQGGLWGELSAIQQPTGGMESAGRRKRRPCLAHSCLLPASIAGQLLRETNGPSQVF